MGLFNGKFFSIERLDKRIQLAGERKWFFISIALVVLAVMCNGALSLILSGIGLFFKAVSTVVMAAAALIGAIIEFIVLIVKWIGSLIYDSKIK